MSKPGNTPIIKKRPFFKDENFEISTLHESSKITGFEVTIKNVKEGVDLVKVFKVNDKNEITKAWQETEKFLNPIAADLLKLRKK